MSNIVYRFRIRNAANSADAITITSIRGGTNPYLSTDPQGDGATFDPLSCASVIGAYTGQIADWPIGSAQRVLTSQLENGTTFTQQLGYRRAFVEESTDGGSTWSVLVCGVLTLLRLVDAITWEYTVTDPMRVQAVTQVFSPASSTTISAFLAQWPNRGCILGGPIIGAAFFIKDLGGWQMKVESGGTGIYILRPVRVYGPPNWIADDKIENVADAINQALVPYQINLKNSAQLPWSTIRDTYVDASAWAGVTMLIDSGSGFVPWRPYPFDYSNNITFNGNLGFDSVTDLLISTRKGDQGCKVISDGTATLTVGSIVKLRCITTLPSEISPIYIQGHPVDILTALWDSVATATGITYSSSACAALKNLIGTNAYFALRVTGPTQLSDLVTTICAPFGIGIRGDSTGALVPFLGRKVGNVPPSTTITGADVVAGSTRLVFELDASQAVQTVTFTQQRFTDQRSAPVRNASIVDSIIVADETVTMINSDATGVPFGQFDLRTEGMVHAASAKQVDIQSTAIAIAQTIFDRFGHGPIALETTFRRGGAGDSVQLGDEVLVNLPQLPNHNYRLGDNLAIAARAMQVVRRTVTSHGYDVRLLDSGPNAQPYATVPTLTIAASTDQPRTVALVTITNAATLNAASVGARLQWAVTTGAVPASTDYTDFIAWPAGQIPTAAFRLSPVIAGGTVYVQARTELVNGNRPSNYGTPAHITLSSVADPSALTATPNGADGSLCVLTWTPGSGTSADLVDVWLRLSGQTFAQATRLKTLNGGSNTYQLEGLTGSTVYVATVQYRDPKTNDVSDPIDVTFTSGATVRTLSAPLVPNGFSGSADPLTGAPRRDGVYGIVVLAAEIPGFIEVQEAVETAVGAGTYGSFAIVGTLVPSVSGNWTQWSRIAPNDGLRRQLKARHIGDGVTSSALTAVVTVTPWTFSAIPPLPTNIICEVTMLTPSPSTDAGINLRFQVDGVDPFGTVCQVEVVSVQGSGVAIVSGPSAGTLSANDTVWKVSQPTSGSGPGTIVCRAQAPDGRKADVSITVPEQASVALPQGTGSVSANGVASFVVDLPPNCNSFKALGSTSAYPTAASTVSGGVLTNTPGGGVTTIAGLTLAFGATEFLTIVPFTGSSASGTQLQSIHLQAAYQDTTGNTKFDSYGGAQFVLRDPTITTARADTSTNVFLADAGSNPTKPQAAVGLKISNGITITSVSLTGKLNFTSGTTERLTVAVIAINKTSGGVTSIGAPETNSASSAVQSVTVSGLSHVVDTNTNTYIGRLLLADSGATGTALELWSLTIAYTQNHTNQGT